MGTRKVYLENKPWQEALADFLAALEPEGFFVIEDEEIKADNSLGRITSVPVTARMSSPHYRASAMDGIAVNSAKTFGAAETNPILLEVGVDAVVVDTGDPIPDGFDAVIMIEQVNFLEGNKARIIAPAVPWQHVRAIGEDVIKKEMILPSNHLIGPYDIGAMTAAGVEKVMVKVKPRVAILPTGDELVSPGEEIKPGGIVEYNSKVMAGLTYEWHGEPVIYPIIKDRFEEIKSSVLKALQENHMVVINAGSSAGRDDYTSAVIDQLGMVCTHGVAIKPGKPVILGIVHGKPVIGIPGYPVSSALTYEMFVKSLIYKKLGRLFAERPKLEVSVAKPLYSTLGLEEMIRVKIGKVDNKFVAAPLERGAGVMMSLVRADGIVKVPRLSEGIEIGVALEADLLKPLKQIEKAVLICGSHDLTLDVINDLLHRAGGGYSLSSSHVGSLGGISALKRKEAHCAGMHLLDTKTGEYNIPYVEKHLAGEELLLVNLVYRQQGLMVARGNPQNINSIESLMIPDIRFINRQKGAGTRILFDFLLEKAGIQGKDVAGYQKEEYNHLAVAAAVAEGVVDVGMGIMAAAQAMDLDFIPLIEERYDICIPKAYMEDERIRQLLGVISSMQFKREVEKLGGYRTDRTGEIVWSNFRIEEEAQWRTDLPEI
ncbi:MAG: molybdopterin biosynthesis protein [Bacillota bacterium]